MAKNELSPMPDDITKGLLARKAMQKEPAAVEMSVAQKTAFHRGEPVSKPVRRFGLRAMMYAMVINVVRPAISSVLTLVPFSFSLKSFSMINHLLYKVCLPQKV